MKILFIGNFDVDYCTEVHHKKTFEHLGHEVVTVQENRCSYFEIMSKLEGIDILFHTHTHGWHVEKLADIYSYCKEKGIPTVGYHLDLWLGIEREKDLDTDPYWNIEYFFCVDQLMVDLLNKDSSKPKTYFLPAGVYDKECYLSPSSGYKHDIIFVGSRGYHPEWPYRFQLITWLEATYGSRFAQYGGGGLGTIRGKELNQLYADSKIVVGDTLCKDFCYPEYLSDRIFETTGRGGFLIHPFIKGMERHFKIEGQNKEVVAYEFNNFQHLKENIDFYLENDARREEIRLAGHNRTKKDHTYKQRLQYILKTIKKDGKTNKN